MTIKDKLIESTMLALQGKLTEETNKDLYNKLGYNDYTNYEDSELSRYAEDNSLPDLQTICNLLDKYGFDYDNLYGQDNVIQTYKLYKDGLSDSVIEAILEKAPNPYYINKFRVLAKKLNLTSQEIKDNDYYELEDRVKQQSVLKKLNKLNLNKDQLDKIIKSPYLSQIGSSIDDGVSGEGILALSNIEDADTFRNAKICLDNGLDPKDLDFVINQKQPFTTAQMKEIIEGLKSLDLSQVKQYANSEYSSQKMRKLRLSFENGESEEDVLNKTQKDSKQYSNISTSEILTQLSNVDDLLYDLNAAYKKTNNYDSWLNNIDNWIYDGRGLIKGIIDEFNVSRSKAITVGKKLYKLAAEYKD